MLFQKSLHPDVFFILRFVKDKVYCAKLQKIMNLKETVKNAFQEINDDKLLREKVCLRVPSYLLQQMQKRYKNSL